jgi:hypothetical protein
VRTVKPTAAAVTVAIAGAATVAATVAAGRFASDAALKAPPGKPLPTEPRLTVHSTAAGQITLTRALASQRPGVYGLERRRQPRGRRPAPERRPALRRHGRTPPGTRHPRHPGPGDKVWFTPGVHIGNPSAALGLDHADVDVPGELGALPAWFVPAARDTWVITVHGLGATREHPMNVMEFLHRHQFPVLDLAYRGDLGAPRPRRPEPPRRDRVARPGRGHPLRRALRRRTRRPARLVHRRHHGPARRRPLGDARPDLRPRPGLARPQLGDHAARPRHGPPHPRRPAAAGRPRRPGPHRSARRPHRGRRRPRTAQGADPRPARPRRHGRPLGPLTPPRRPPPRPRHPAHRSAAPRTAPCGTPTRPATRRPSAASSPR